MARKVKVALAGLGSVSQRGILPHLAQDDAREKMELVACCDVVADRAKETARVFGWRESYGDYDEMLARADVEAVLIATPIPAHYEQTMKALNAGKHVYVQKTMTTTLAEANDVVDLAARKGLKLVASPGQMLRPLNQQIKRLLKEGVIGKVYWAFTTNAGGGHEFEVAPFRRGRPPGDRSHLVLQTGRRTDVRHGRLLPSHAHRYSGAGQAGDRYVGHRPSAAASGATKSSTSRWTITPSCCSTSATECSPCRAARTR